MGNALIPGAIVTSGGGQYTVDRLLTEKAFASSYAASELSQKVFLKQYNDPSVIFTPWFRDYESYQAEIIQRLHGLKQMVVQVKEAFVFKNEYFQAHEWAEGGDLDGYIKSRTDSTSKQAFEEARAYGVMLLKELQCLHAAGIVHTDLKPDNVFVRKTAGCPPLVKLVDFDWSILRDTPKFPWEGGPRGTPFYMSPEHLSGRAVTDRSDVYTAALIVIELLTGVNPLMRVCGQRSFTPEEHAAFLSPIQGKRNIPRPSQLNSSVRLPKHLDDALFTCLHPDPSQRLTAKQLCDALSTDEQRPVRLLLRYAKNPSVFLRFGAEDYKAGKVILCHETFSMLRGYIGDLVNDVSSYANHRFNGYVLPGKIFTKWFFVSPPTGWEATNPLLINAQRVVGTVALGKGDKISIGRLELLVDYECVS